jgi:hypothetical protein
LTGLSATEFLVVVNKIPPLRGGLQAMNFLARIKLD